MADLIHEYRARVSTRDGAEYAVKAYGERREDGRWIGWLQYEPVGPGRVLRTDGETTQTDPQDLRVWADGLETVYLEGALDRAWPVDG